MAGKTEESYIKTGIGQAPIIEFKGGMAEGKEPFFKNPTTSSSAYMTKIETGKMEPKYGVFDPGCVEAKYGVVDPGKIEVKYGVFDPGQVEAKYGVVDPGQMEAKYGVFDPGIIEEKYGVNMVAPDISITYNQLEDNISFLKKAIADLKESWGVNTKKNIDLINNSWVGPDCIAYTDKLTSMDNKVQKTISSLELLCSTYENARDMVQDKQASIMSSINNS